jgi:hypothetical protein
MQSFLVFKKNTLFSLTFSPHKKSCWLYNDKQTLYNSLTKENATKLFFSLDSHSFQPILYKKCVQHGMG